MIEQNLNFTLASRTKRFIAYFFDILIIVGIIFFVFYRFFDFDTYWHNYMDNPSDIEIRKAFLKQRNHIRNLSLAIWIIYGFFMDTSSWQGTLGKKIVGIKVSDSYGNRINFVQSMKRNFSKMLSVIPLFIGIFWIFFDKQKRCWHDKIAKTVIIE